MAHIDGDHIVVSVPEAVLVSDVVTDEGIMFEHDLGSEVVEGPDICCSDEPDGIIMTESVLGAEVAIEDVLDSDHHHHVLTADLIEESDRVPDQVFEIVTEEVMVSNCNSETYVEEQEEDSAVTIQEPDDEAGQSVSEDYLMISCKTRLIFLVLLDCSNTNVDSNNRMNLIVYNDVCYCLCSGRCWGEVGHGGHAPEDGF